MTENKETLRRNFHRACQRVDFLEVTRDLEKHRKVGEGKSFAFYHLQTVDFSLVVGVSREPLQKLRETFICLEKIGQLNFSWLPPFFMKIVEREASQYLCLAMPYLKNFRVISSECEFAQQVAQDLQEHGLTYDDFFQTAWFEKDQFVVDIASIRSSGAPILTEPLTRQNFSFCHKRKS